MERFRQARNPRIQSRFHTLVILFLLASLFFGLENLYAKPVTKTQAQKAITGWLKRDQYPLKTPLGKHVRNIDVFTDDKGQPTYYIVYLEPSGFAIVPADDLIEPIIGFVPVGLYDPSLENPLGALVGQDLPGRIAAARTFQLANATQTTKKDQTTDEKLLKTTFLKAQTKWKDLQTYADSVEETTYGSDISDVWVSPLVQSKWSQADVCGNYCYNYYTPPPDPCGHYPCGCVATAMAQIMYFHEYPTTGIDVNTFEITVNDYPEDVNTRGGDGAGGPYNWHLMKTEPNCSTEPNQLEAIGALCYDAGVSVNMEYTPDVSYAYLHTVNSFNGATQQLQDIFGYSNAIAGYYEADIGAGLNNMINPNLDANHPVILGVRGRKGGHAILADGYGYDLSTLYHHLNMGWGGDCDAWYNLPDIYTDDPCLASYSSVEECVYNIFVSGSGEIISGRVVDTYGEPISGATVTAEKDVNEIYTAVTNSRGIYSLTNVPSDSTYTISVIKSGYYFFDRNITTGTSNNAEITSGNLWGVDFTGISKFGCNFIGIGNDILTWYYPMRTNYEDSRVQIIYLASELKTSGTITSLALDVETVPGETMNNWTIRMKHTNKSSYGTTASFEATGWTVVYQTDEPNGSTGWRKFNFSTPFEYNGTDNLLIDFSYNNWDYSTFGECRCSSPGGERSVYACSEDEDGDPLEWSGSSSPDVFRTTKVPDIQLTICNRWPGDFEPDYDVDSHDFAILASAWQSSDGQANWNPDCDIAPQPPDGLIDELDLAVFAEYWLRGTNQ